MSLDEDYKYALELHERLNGGSEGSEGDYTDSDIQYLGSNKSSQKTLQTKRNNLCSSSDDDYLNRTQNLVHPQWEILDPTPDIFALFGQFDDKFFQCRLKCVTLEWSKRMFSCAGICYSRKNALGMDVTIRLSEPLLKLRSRKDLIETMLHEMIHAYCFVLHIREGNGGHGPQFQKIMNAINQTAGTNITVYHSFHDEVKLYKQHWWRCNGVCQNRSPFFGYVKRTCNRAPGPNDFWWAKHQQDCGGAFIKIKEPDKKSKSKANKKLETKNDKNPCGSEDLRKFFTPTTNGSQGREANVKGLHNLNNGFKGGSTKTNGGGTVLLNPRTKTASNSSPTAAKIFPPTSYPGLSSDHCSIPINQPSPSSLPRGNLHNVVSLKDIGTNIRSSSFQSSDWGRGNSLSTSTPKDDIPSGQVDRQFLRNVWAKRFNSCDADCDKNNGSKKHKRNEDDVPGDIKRKRISNTNKSSASSEPSSLDKKFSMGVHHRKDCTVIDEIINLSSSEDSDNDNDFQYKSVKPTIHKNMTTEERQTMIKQEIIDDSTFLSDTDIEIIGDEFDDNFEGSDEMIAAGELADISVIDEFFGEDTLLKDLQTENGSIVSESSSSFNNDIITCPVCQTKMPRSQLADHLDCCTGISEKIEPNERTNKKEPALSKKTRKISKSAKDILRDAGYSEADLSKIVNLDYFDGDENGTIQLYDH
uniref:Protein with SprT-like domain at the N terminus n=1 Tax=Glossina austeni TaxID=7395 RepID=A0A1A9VRW7_GLOAU